MNVSLEFHISKSICQLLRNLDDKTYRSASGVFACRGCGFFFLLGKTNFAKQTNGWTCRQRGHEEKTRSGGTEVLDRPSVLCSILCLYSLKEYYGFRPSEVYGIMDTQRRSAFTPKAFFFCTNGSFFFSFFFYVFCAVDGVAFGCWTYWK